MKFIYSSTPQYFPYFSCSFAILFYLHFIFLSCCKTLYCNWCVICVYGNQTGDQEIIVTKEGDDALLPCTLQKSTYSNDTVLWKRASTNEILTAGTNRISKDKRINIFHDKCKYYHFSFYNYYFFKTISIYPLSNSFFY